MVPRAPDPLIGLQTTSELTTEAPETLQIREMDLTPISTTSTVKSGPFKENNPLHSDHPGGYNKVFCAYVLTELSHDIVYVLDHILHIASPVYSILAVCT